MWLPWQPCYDGNKTCGLLSLGTSKCNINSIALRTKELLTYQCGCRDNPFTLATWDLTISNCPYMFFIGFQTKRSEVKLTFLLFLEI